MHFIGTPDDLERSRHSKALKKESFLISFNHGVLKVVISKNLIALLNGPKLEEGSENIEFTLKDKNLTKTLNSPEFKLLYKYRYSLSQDLFLDFFTDEFSFNFAQLLDDSFSKEGLIKALSSESLPLKSIEWSELKIRFVEKFYSSPFRYRDNNFTHLFEVIQGDKYFQLIFSIRKLWSVIQASNHAIKNMLKEVMEDFYGVMTYQQMTQNLNVREELWKSIKKIENGVWVNHVMTSKKQEQIKNIQERHQFVISTTKELDNPKFSELAERALVMHLREGINKKVLSDLVGNDDPLLLDIKNSIIWQNEKGESGRPYDIELGIVLSPYSFRKVLFPQLNERVFIEVKATRGNEDSIFYFSTKELRFLVNNVSNYVLARVAFIGTGAYKGIRIHDEFLVNFYQPAKDLISLISSNIVEWEEHYKAPEVRFTIEHFNLIK